MCPHWSYGGCKASGFDQGAPCGLRLSWAPARTKVPMWDVHGVCIWTAQVRTKSSRALLVSEGPLLPARRAHFSSYVRFEPGHFDVWNVVLRDAGHCNYTFPSAWRARCFGTLLKRWQAWEIRGGSEVIVCGRRIIEWTRTKVWKALVAWNRHTRNLGQMMISRGRCNTSGASGSCVVASTVFRRPQHKTPKTA